MKKIKFSIFFEDIWLWLGLFIGAGTLVYFLYALDWLGLIAAFLIASILYYALKPNLKKTRQPENEKTNRLFWIYAAISLFLNIITIIMAANAGTEAAIISPWTQINPWFFAALIGASFALIGALNQPAAAKYKKILLVVYLFNIFSVAAFVYRLGYGFDPFIHQAAETEINQHGYILPKTPYYLGQYSLIIFLHKISGLSLFRLNQWLVPVFSALALPALLSYLQRDRQDKISAWLASLFLIFLSFSPFIITTPQNFSYLWLLATVIFLYKRAAWPLSVISALAAFAIHPLAGIPALFLVGWTLLPQIHLNKKITALFKRPAVIFSISTVIFCLTIWTIADFSSLSLQNFNLSLLNPVFANSESYLLNLSYGLINNYFWLILIGGLIIFFCRRRLWAETEIKNKNQAELLSLNALAALSAYLISRGFIFSGLIAYEQDNYAARLPLVAVIIALPLFWELFYHLSRRARTHNKITQILLASGASLMLAVTVYGSYPRFDNYYNSRGYSTGAADIKAVKRAEELADNQTYIALADQQVSAAALKELGFRRYLNTTAGEIYFYPIPTGGPLYQYFLDMVYRQATRETMTKAMDFAQVDRAYLIINRYWWASDKIIAEAKLSADSWEKIDQGEVYLFEYRR